MKNILESLWCRYNSIPLRGTQLSILRLPVYCRTTVIKLSCLDFYLWSLSHLDYLLKVFFYRNINLRLVFELVVLNFPIILFSESWQKLVFLTVANMVIKLVYERIWKWLFIFWSSCLDRRNRCPKVFIKLTKCQTFLNLAWVNIIFWCFRPFQDKFSNCFQFSVWPWHTQDQLLQTPQLYSLHQDC